MSIRLLDPITSNKIAAGEVVERPSAVVKELVENAMDAGADRITVEVRQGGKTYIRVTDNGVGISTEDLPLAFERHATSKIIAIEDLDHLTTLGFRGEALASIASVSFIEMITRHQASESGQKIDVQGGKVRSVEPVGATIGTTVIVRDLFYNTPARLKFLKSNGAELSAITEWISRLAISRPEISFRFLADQTDVFMTSGNRNLRETVAAVYERSLAKSLVPVDVSKEGITIQGLVGDLNATRGNRQLQLFFVNGRSVKSSLLSEALEMGYQTLLPINRFPVCFLSLELDGSRLDINMHPAKTQIRFQEENTVRQTVCQTVREALLQKDLVPAVRFNTPGAAKAPATEASVKETPAVSTVIPQRVSYEPLISETPSFAAEAIQESPKEPVYQSLGDQDHRFTETDIRTSMEKHNLLLHKPVDEMIEAPMPTADLDVLLQIPSQIQFEPEIEPKFPFVQETLYEGLSLIGQLFRTYVLAEKEDALYMIDQHAAHEKVLYETFMAQWRNHRINSQWLLTPEVLSLDPAIVQYSEDLLPVAAEMGFEAEVFGVDAIIVRSVPLVSNTPLSVELLGSMLEDGSRQLRSGRRLEDVRIEAIIRESCKKAIKADDSLSLLEIQGLIDQLKKLESPYTCPHGRPIIIKMEKSEIERRFKRI